MAKVKKKVNKVKVVIKENPVFNYIFISIFIVFLCLLTTFKISGDDDVFWHLATGRYIVQTHNVPSTDIFGFVTQGMEWMPFEWGWDVISYIIYSFSGFTGLSVFRTFLLILIFSIFFIILRKLKIQFTTIFIFITALAFSIMDRLTPRPHLMSYLFISLLLLIIVQYRYVNRNNHRILFFIPLIFIFWANLHMGIIAGMFLFGIYILSELLMFLYPLKFSSKQIPILKKPEIIRLILIALASVIVMLINPNSYDTYIYAYSHTKMKMLETVNEWMSPFSSRYSESFVSILYKIFLFLGILILYYAYKKKDIFPALLYIGFSLYSIRAMRFTIDYILVCFVFIVLSVDYIISNLKNESVRNFTLKKPYLKILLTVIIIYCIIRIPDNKLYLQDLKYYRISGFGINSDFIPTQMFDFLRENRINEIGERPFNHFGTGGFLVWNFPESKNFIDSRNLNDSIFFEYNTIITKKPGFEKKINEYNFDYAIYLAPDLVRMPQEMEQTIISYFVKKNDDWKLVFWDDKSFLFVKNLPKFKDIINRFEYKYINPYNYGYQRNIIDNAIKNDLQTVKNEINRKLNEDRNSIVINSILQIFGNKINN